MYVILSDAEKDVSCEELIGYRIYKGELVDNTEFTAL
jgi:hypothetical protein